MVTALDTSRSFFPPRYGIASRLLRRFGGAVRNVIAGGSSLAGALRRQSASQPGIGHTMARNAVARPAPRHAQSPRRPRASHPVQPSLPARPGFLPRWLARRARRRAARISSAWFPANPDVPFTPESYPGLCPELCAILNTPLEDLDPAILRIMLESLAKTIAEIMPPEAGLTDADSVFSTLWTRLAGALEEPTPDPSPAATAPINHPDLSPSVPARSSVPAFPRVPTEAHCAPTFLPLSTQTPRPPQPAPIASQQATAISHRGRHIPHRRPSFRYKINSTVAYRVRLLAPCAELFRHRREDFLEFTRQRPPARPRCYAARASPA